MMIQDVKVKLNRLNSSIEINPENLVNPLTHFVKIGFLFYLVELCILHGSEVEPRLLALVLQHMIQQLGGRLHIVAVVMVGVIGGTVKQAHNGLGAFTVHP